MDISSIYPGCILLTGWWWRGWRMMVTTLILGQEDGQDGGGLTWARSLVEWWQFSTFATLIVAFDTLPGNCDNDDNDGDKVDSQQFHQAATSSRQVIRLTWKVGRGNWLHHHHHTLRNKWRPDDKVGYTCSRRRHPRTQSQSPLSKPGHKIVFRPTTK